MELSKQVVSLELAKKLKSLGVKQESLYFWVRYRMNKKFALLPKEETFEDIAPERIQEIYSAFTIAELGELLPATVNNYYNLYIMKEEKFDNWYVFYKPKAGGTERLVTREADTEADARAKCLQYLIENNLLTLQQGDNTTDDVDG